MAQKREKQLDIDRMCWQFLGAVRQISHAVDVRSHSLERRYGVTLPQLHVLWAIGAEDEVPIGQVAERLSLSGATVSTIVDRLVERNLLLRKRSTNDKRSVLLALTETGATTLKSIGQPFDDGFVEELESIGEWRRTELLSSVQHVGSMLAQSVDET